MGYIEYNEKRQIKGKYLKMKQNIDRSIAKFEDALGEAKKAKRDFDEGWKSKTTQSVIDIIGKYEKITKSYKVWLEEAAQECNNKIRKLI